MIFSACVAVCHPAMLCLLPCLSPVLVTLEGRRLSVEARQLLRRADLWDEPQRIPALQPTLEASWWAWWAWLSCACMSGCVRYCITMSHGVWSTCASMQSVVLPMCLQCLRRGAQHSHRCTRTHIRTRTHSRHTHIHAHVGKVRCAKASRHACRYVLELGWLGGSCCLAPGTLTQSQYGRPLHLNQGNDATASIAVPSGVSRSRTGADVHMATCT